MGTKAENFKIIKELDEELSDEKIAELFQIDEDGFNGTAARRRSKRKMTARSLIILLVIVLCVVVVLQFFSPRIVNERSMENTITVRDCVVLALQAYSSSEAEYGDIIMLETYLLDTEGRARDLVKRVIGLPGDMVEVRDGSVFLNGQRLDEPYTKDVVTDGEMAPEQVPEGCLFVLGDHRKISIDSRDARVGYVKNEQIIGKVVFRLLPLSKSGVFK